MKRFFLIFLLLVVLAILGFVAWLFFWPQLQPIPDTIQEVPAAADTMATSDTSGTTATSGSYEVIMLSSAQQELAAKLGYNVTSITVTPTVRTCITNAVGETRTQELINGDSPSTFEMVKLATCLPR